MVIAARMVLPAVAVPVDTRELGQCSDQDVGTLHLRKTFLRNCGFWWQYTFGRWIGKGMAALNLTMDEFHAQGESRQGSAVVLCRSWLAAVRRCSLVALRS